MPTSFMIDMDWCTTFFPLSKKATLEQEIFDYEVRSRLKNQVRVVHSSSEGCLAIGGKRIQREMTVVLPLLFSST